MASILGAPSSRKQGKQPHASLPRQIPALYCANVSAPTYGGNEGAPWSAPYLSPGRVQRGEFMMKVALALGVAFAAMAMTAQAQPERGHRVVIRTGGPHVQIAADHDGWITRA